MRIVAVEAGAWPLGLRAPFVIAQRTATEAQNVRITVRTEGSGCLGLGASAPVGYVTGESVASVLEALAAVGHSFVGCSITRLRPLLDLVERELADAPAARAGLEMALYDAWARCWNLPLWQFFGGAQPELTTDLTIPIVTPDEARLLAAKAWAEGFQCFKLKVGDPLGSEADLARAAALAEAAPGARLRVDANQAFSPEEAVAFAQALAATGATIEMLEQPVDKDDRQGLKYVRDHVPMPVFADEAARDIASVRHLLATDAVDGINVKLMKSGITESLQIIALCRAAGKMLMLGCMLESRLGIAAAAQIAGGTGAFDFLDLDSHRLLAPVGGLTGGFTALGETLSVDRQGPGWGVEFTAGNNLDTSADKQEE